MNTFNYLQTHISVRDGSTAMLVSETPFTLVNEDGFTWVDESSAWREIAQG